MQTIYDFVTVGCFFALIAAYLTLTERQTKTLAYLMIAGVVFAVANQIGNSGRPLLAIGLVVAGIVYAAIVVHASRSDG